MTVIRLLPKRIFDGRNWHQDTAVVVFNDRIIALEAPNGEEIALKGDMVPGFIDVQVNGGGGVLFNATPTESALAKIIKTHSLFGSCGILPTLVTDSVEVMQQAADAVANVIKDKVPGILGVHFEGPHLSVEKKGVHSTDYIRTLTDAEKAIFSRDDLGIKVVTLAPENVSPEDIQYLVDANV
ncbi:MAG: N-acetylglucosamine-6-phosphate deacetylase, partial [Psychrosphaera sp.]|nr:N-acetylglucosamine-6-phosphate deacetylase [Psychrosphaera sp.]